MSEISDNFGIAVVKEACPICCKEIEGPIIIGKRRSKKHAIEINAMNGKVVNWAKEPCSECKKLIDDGCFFIIGVDGSKTTDPKNPYRSGHIVGITKECDFYKNLPEEVKTTYGMYMDYRQMKDCGLINEA